MREKHLAKLIASVVVSSIFLTGCGGDATEQAVAVQNEKNNSDITGIHVTDGAKYQYQVIDPKDIIIEYSGLKSDQSLAKYKGKYVTDTSVYLSNQVGVYLGEDHYTATVGEYVQYTDINWKWDSNNNWDMFVNTRNGVTEGDASMFEGIIDYADGTQSSVTADSVELGFEDNGNTEVVSIKFRDDTYTYKFAIPESWWDEGDGSELSAEDLEALRGQDTEMTQDGSSSRKVFSEKDASGLVSLDWGVFNRVIPESDFYGNMLNDDVFEVLGNDPRISNDWSELSTNFLVYYGNDELSMISFVRDLEQSYLESSTFIDGNADYAVLYIEPYYTWTHDEGRYGNISENELKSTYIDNTDEVEEYKSTVNYFINKMKEGYIPDNPVDDVFYGLVTYYCTDYDICDVQKRNERCKWKLQLCDSMLEDSDAVLYNSYLEFARSEFSNIGLDYDLFIAN